MSKSLKGSEAKWQVTFTCYLPPSTVGKSKFFKVWGPKGNSVGNPTAKLETDEGTWTVSLDKETAAMPVFDDARPVKFTSPMWKGEDGIVGLGVMFGFLTEEVKMMFNKFNVFRVTVNTPTMVQPEAVQPWLPVIETINLPGYPEAVPGEGFSWNPWTGDLVTTFKMTESTQHAMLAVFVSVALATASHNDTLPQPGVDVLKDFAYLVMQPANLVTPIGRAKIGGGANWHGSRDWHKALVDCRKSAGVARKAA